MTSKSFVNFVSIKVCMYTNVLSTFFLKTPVQVTLKEP